jgi:hypothetical protein
MPTRTQTPTRPAGGRFGRTAGKPAQRPARERRTTSARRPAMPTIGRRPKKSGAAKAAEKLGGLLPGTRGQKRGASGGPGKKGTASRKSGASGGPGKKGTAGLALLAGAAGLLVKNREKLTSMMRGSDSSRDAATPGEPQATPVASNSGPVDPAAIANPPTFPDHPAA